MCICVVEIGDANASRQDSGGRYFLFGAQRLCCSILFRAGRLSPDWALQQKKKKSVDVCRSVELIKGHLINFDKFACQNLLVTLHRAGGYE